MSLIDPPPHHLTSIADDARSDDEICRALARIDQELAKARAAFPVDRQKVYAHLRLIASFAFVCSESLDPRAPMPM